MTSRIEVARAWLAGVAVFTLLIGVFTVFGGVARANHVSPDDIVPHSSDANQGPFWETYLSEERDIDDATCSKVPDSGSDAFVMPSAPDGESWVLLVVKQATWNYVYYDPTGGHTYPSTGDQSPGYSHAIVCSAEVTTTTTPPEPTTTTTILGTTITTTPGSTTTIPDQTTTVPDQTTTVPDQTTTTILGTTITSPTSTLPFTGVGSEQVIGIAIMLLGGGILLTVAGLGRREEA